MSEMNPYQVLPDQDAKLVMGQRLKDLERLRKLSLTHYVISFVAGIASMLPLFYVLIGFYFVTGNAVPAPQKQVGIAFLVFGGAGFLSLLVMAIAMAVAARCLSIQRSFTFCAIVGILEFFFFPFGTLLSIFTLIALSQRSVRGLFP